VVEVLTTKPKVITPAFVAAKLNFRKVLVIITDERIPKHIHEIELAFRETITLSFAVRLIEITDVLKHLDVLESSMFSDI